jgi:hypothetical protein
MDSPLFMMIVGMLVLFNYLVVWFYYYARKLCYNTFKATKCNKNRDMRIVGENMYFTQAPVRRGESWTQVARQL